MFLMLNFLYLKLKGRSVGVDNGTYRMGVVMENEIIWVLSIVALVVCERGQKRTNHV